MPLTYIRFFVAGRPWLADLTRPIDLAREVQFNPDAETWFGAPPPSSQPLKQPEFTGSVRLGGTVNVDVLTLTPHCAGTHTEGVGHLTVDGQSLEAPLALIPALVASMPRVSPECVEELTSQALPGFLEGLVLRPSTNQPLMFDPAAVRHLVEAGVQHLLVEEPSVDPKEDGGRLAAHRAFWGVPMGVHSGASRRTITELIRVPASAPDGPYLLDLQTPSLRSDAVPSRPVLYPVVQAE